MVRREERLGPRRQNPVTRERRGRSGGRPGFAWSRRGAGSFVRAGAWLPGAPLGRSPCGSNPRPVHRVVRASTRAPTMRRPFAGPKVELREEPSGESCPALSPATAGLSCIYGTQQCVVWT